MLLLYVMIPLDKKELDISRETVWNTHRIRAQEEAVLRNGIPNHIYSFPMRYDLEECSKCKYCSKCRLVYFMFVYIMLIG